jgi:hypothetical protein
MNPVANPQSAIQDQQFFYGVLAQLVERLNGIDTRVSYLELSQGVLKVLTFRKRIQKR